MAIYRTGQASMDADGYITGYGTKWKTALTLIRPGATIVFASNPVAYATISEIVNDTSLRATSTGGAVVPRGDYVILLHDSITVDGLAQDVAETLRYYQGQETMYQEFVEFLKGFDWQKLEEIDRNTEANAASADASAKAAAQSESNANASKNAAAASATTASQQASAASSSASAAKVSENNAASSKTAAANSASSASTSATTAGQHKDAAAASASAAKTSETNASASKTAAAASASAAKTSETNAKSSETNAASSASAANTAKNEAQTAASSANASKSAAANSATAAAGSATTAKNEADRAAELAKQLDATNLMRKDANLSDVTNKATARANLQVDRLNQDSTTETKVLSADGSQALIAPNGSTWGLYRFGSGWVPLSIAQGGTGATSGDAALKALGLWNYGVGTEVVGGMAAIRNLSDIKGAGFYNIAGDGATNPTVGAPPGSGNVIMSCYAVPIYSTALMIIATKTNGETFYGNYNPQTKAVTWSKGAGIFDYVQVTGAQDAVNMQVPSGTQYTHLCYKDSNGTVRWRATFNAVNSNYELYCYNSAGAYLKAALSLEQSGNATLNGKFTTLSNLKSLTSWPAVELEKTTMEENVSGRRIVIENNESSLNFYFSNATDNTGRYTVMLRRPTNATAHYLAFDGGLSHDGRSNPIDTGNDFNTVYQGWRNIGGSFVNSPNGASASSVYGSLFTQATQGLSVGRAKDQGVNGQWYQQRFYDTSNRIFSRVQTNEAAWGVWQQVTMSAVSDERLKDIKGNLNVEGALDNINRMEFKLFNFKEEMIQGKAKTTRRGVISQQIRMIDKEYVKNVGGYWHLDKTPMLLDGLAAIKALRARDEENKERIAKLEGEVEELKAMVAALIAK